MFIMNDHKGRLFFRFAQLHCRRKSVRQVTIQETSNKISRTPLADIFREQLNTDTELHLTNGKRVKCHKTVLSSKVPFFKAYFSGTWNSHDIFGEELEFIIHYCYGFVENVPNHLMIPLIKKSHEYELKDLLKTSLSALSFSISNFFEHAQHLEDYLDEPLFEDVKRKLITFGMENKNGLFTKKNLEMLRKIPKLNAEIMVEWAKQ
ncbi:hypothetical protein FDP41_012808 [Naegleria fowleri]|uniref:BTB domain-containing protein n=1 Tax=Naegleria fowleri TaxID=5763 RepID=A0A6A5C593_NAEFO|nr:uncharacterized protein FDP41_012808 [Naegleria fowleri]KAF0981020.1 hypothetical protein FDP41_012808 [Naegleria fowleri]